MSKDLNYIVSKFQLEGDIENIRPLGEGFINDTFFVKTFGDTHPVYLLQITNKHGRTI
ncbi:hypothetical protein [Labilibaculum antarcticum]|uniref:Serine kinase n=1 Tax=Labilibaculum antarcticum TaxID=1717717 RepID=A0A1Y1CF27_9BACT|nr:hypothetical protein [Labilibaculum antarcticum]BAX78959.1 serine kinase [Labilibaculum antarcticum]